MIFRVITISMALLMFVGSLQAGGWILADCAERPCCGHSASMDEMTAAGPAEDRAVLQSPEGCCCGEAGATSCSLTRVVPLEKIGWALSPHRADPSAQGLAGILSLEKPIISEEGTPFNYTLVDTLHPVSPPTYLTVMSFLC